MLALKVPLKHHEALSLYNNEIGRRARGKRKAHRKVKGGRVKSQDGDEGIELKVGGNGGIQRKRKARSAGVG